MKMKKAILSVAITLLFACVARAGDLDSITGFSQIVREHPGKVIVVDFWNTWCKACCKAMGDNEQLKTGRLHYKDIVWVYIADESSPEADWKYLIRYFKGIHYRISKEQIVSLYEELGIDSLPSYILVTKDGKYEKRDDMREQKTYIKAIKEAVK